MVPRADLRDSCHDNILRVLELLAAAVDGRRAGPGRARAADPAYDAARATGRRRAEQGLPLDDVLRSFRMGGRLIWDDLVEQAALALDAEELREVGTRLWEVVDETSAQVAAAYHARRAGRRPRRRAAARRAVGGRAQRPGQGARASPTRPRGSSTSRSTATTSWSPAPTSTAPGSSTRWRPGPTAWVRRSGGAVGLVAAAARRPAGRALRGALGRRGRGPVGVSVGGPRPGAGVDTGFRQAVAGAAHPGGRRGLAAFDDRLPEALLLSAPEVAGRLVAVWLGPLLALPAAEQRPLLDTLEAWVATGGSTTHTAPRVHCHRNTVINRLRRVATLTGRADPGCGCDGVPPARARPGRCAALGDRPRTADGRRRCALCTATAVPIVGTAGMVRGA